VTTEESIRFFGGNPDHVTLLLGFGGAPPYSAWDMGRDVCVSRRLINSNKFATSLYRVPF